MGTSLVDTGLVAIEKRRRYVDLVGNGTWTDQWGRRWKGNIDRQTFHPSGPLIPDGWSAPHALLYPPPKYQWFPKGMTGEMVIKLDDWITHTHQAWKLWGDEMGAFAHEKFAQMAQKAIEDGNPTLMAFAGPSPLSLDFLYAMKARNSWVLGIPSPKTGRLVTERPGWADAVWVTLKRQETFDGSDAVLSPDDLSKYADEDEGVESDTYAPANETAAEIAERLALAARFGDLDDDAPQTEPIRAPVPRGHGGKFTKRTE